MEEYKVGDRIEVKYDHPGGWPWSAARVIEVSPSLPGHARVVFDEPSPTPHPSWWASPENIRVPEASHG